nr:MAG TPA: hypothetical protein [Caudoviricetes sp.]
MYNTTYRVGSALIQYPQGEYARLFCVQFLSSRLFFYF